MSQEPDHDTALQIAEEAADWLERLKTAGPEERANFLTWLRASPQHAREMLLATAWDRVLDDLERGKPVSQLEAQRPAPQATRMKPINTRRAHGLRWFVTATAMCLMLWVAFAHLSDDQYRTQLGEQRVVRLLDGSSAHLNTLTRISTQFSERARRVHLLEGQSTFDVRPDSERAFIVVAGPYSIRAIGTRFDVYKHDENVRIAVIEGTVEVQTPGGREILTARDALHIAPGMTQHSRIDPQDVLAWQQRRLIFHERTLSDIATEFNRYNRLKLTITDAALSQRTYSGVFDATDPLSFTASLAADPNLVVTRHDSTLRIGMRGG